MVNYNDSVESENECDYAKCLFDGLDSVSCDVKRKDVNFLIYLIGRVENVIEDDEFTEVELRSMEYLKCVKMCVYK